MVTAHVPVAVDAFFIGARVIGEDEVHRRDAGLHERPGIDAADQVAQRLAVRADLDLQALGHRQRRIGQRVLAQPMQGERLQRKQWPQLIKVDDTRDLFLWHGRMLQPPARAQQALFLRRPRREQHRAGITLALAPCRQLTDQRHIAGIVQRAVVQAVAVHRLAKAIAIDMGAQQHHFAGLGLVGAGQQAEHLLAGEAALRRGQFCLEPAGQIKAVKVAVIGRLGQDHRCQPPGAGNQRGQRRAIHPEGRQASGKRAAFVYNGAGIGIGPARGLLREADIIDIEQPHRTRFLQRRHLFGGQRPAGAAAAVTDGDLARHRVADLGHAAITAKAHRGRQRGRQINGRARRDIVQEFQGRGAAIGCHHPHLGGRHRHLVQRHGLAECAAVARRFEFRRLEPAFHQINGAGVAGAAGIAALHRIAGQFGRARQPGSRVGVRLGADRGREKGDDGQDMAHHRTMPR